MKFPGLLFNLASSLFSKAQARRAGGLRRPRYEYSEDLFAETRMSFGEHLEDLRTHLIRALVGFFVGVVLSFFIGGYALDFIKKPVEDALVEYHVEYYKRNKEQVNPLVERLKKEMSTSPELRQLNEPREMRQRLSAYEMDQLRRKLFPELFEPGGPLAHVPPVAPDAEGPGIDLVTRMRPMDFLEPFQTGVALASRRSALTTLSAQEAFMVYFKVCLLVGLVISSPWVFYQLWAFVAAGLYPHEKKYIHYYLPMSLFLFLGGVALCQFAVIPAALKALLYFNLTLNIEPDFRLNEWLGFAILMPVVFGLSFQTPLVMLFLGKIGIFTADEFAAKRRVAIFVICIFAALITPSIDVISMLLLAAPMVGLYELGIVMVRYTESQLALEDLEVPYTPETAPTGSDEPENRDGSGTAP